MASSGVGPTLYEGAWITGTDDIAFGHSGTPAAKAWLDWQPVVKAPCSTEEINPPKTPFTRQFGLDFADHDDIYLIMAVSAGREYVEA